MFAIDCVKANGTHLGTCIDRFYFGSCCLVEPISEIVHNGIDTEVLDQREPPLRISNTTAKPVTSTQNIEIISLNSLHNEVEKVTTTTKKYSQIITTKNPEKIITEKPTISTISSTVHEITFGQKLTTTRPTIPTTSSILSETTTVPQKLQTFQVVDGNPVIESTQMSGTTTTVTSVSNVTSSSTSPYVATKVTTSRPTQRKPTTTKPKPLKSTTTKRTSKPKPTKPSGKSQLLLTCLIII